MVFVERTGFQFGAVSLAEDPDRPIHVNFGLERRVLALSPPIGGVTESPDGTRQAHGDAASLLSGFDMQYEPGSNPLGGTVSISTQFASGEAAREAAKSSELGTSIMAARSKRAWYTVDGGASAKTIEDAINAAQRERGRFVAIEADDDQTVFEIATDDEPGAPIKLETDDVTAMADQKKVATGTARIGGEVKTVTVIRSAQPGR
jgi:hypothetical protein